MYIPAIRRRNVTRDRTWMPPANRPKGDLMPAPSKFTAARRQVVVEHLAAGFSHRRAAAAAQIDHQTLARWIKRGDKAAPGGRWAEFSRAVHLAEDASSPPILVGLRDLKAEYSRWEADPTLAWKFLERSGEFVPPEPVKITVVHAPTTEGA